MPRIQIIFILSHIAYDLSSYSISSHAQASRLFQCQAKSRDETALLIVLASETEVELDEVGQHVTSYDVWRLLPYFHHFFLQSLLFKNLSASFSPLPLLFSFISPCLPSYLIFSSLVFPFHSFTLLSYPILSSFLPSLYSILLPSNLSIKWLRHLA